MKNNYDRDKTLCMNFLGNFIRSWEKCDKEISYSLNELIKQTLINQEYWDDLIKQSINYADNPIKVNEPCTAQ